MDRIFCEFRVLEEKGEEDAFVVWNVIRFDDLLIIERPNNVKSVVK
jgi:hypothetical protein